MSRRSSMDRAADKYLGRSFPPQELPGWRGEELLRLSHDEGLWPPTLIDYSSRLKIGRRESRTSRRFAPGLREEVLISGTRPWLKETKSGRTDVVTGMSTRATIEETIAGRVRVDCAERLESWKEIAVYFRRSVRCVQRWERNESLPVRRHVHTASGTVFAYRTELEAWSRSRAVNDGRSRQRRARGRPVILISSQGLPMRLGRPAQTSWTW